jgi:hypothetical protein
METVMSKHTPGPWQVGPAYDNDGIAEVIIEHKTEHGNLVVAVALGGLVGQAENANLIAAAPDLLEALQALCEYAETSDDCQYGTLSTKFVRDVALPAIAKATGEQE